MKADSFISCIILYLIVIKITFVCYIYCRFSENKEAAKLAQLNVFPSLRFLPSYRKVFDKAKKQFKFLSEGINEICKLSLK